MSDFGLTGDEDSEGLPEGDLHPKRQKRKFIRTGTMSGSQSSPDYEGNSSFMESDSDYFSDGDIPPSKRPKGDLSDRFDPLAKTKQAVWQLNDGQNNFVTKYFSHWLGGSVIQDSILEDCPVPRRFFAKTGKIRF